MRGSRMGQLPGDVSLIAPIEAFAEIFRSRRARSGESSGLSNPPVAARAEARLWQARAEAPPASDAHRESRMLGVVGIRSRQLGMVFAVPGGVLLSRPWSLPLDDQDLA